LGKIRSFRYRRTIEPQIDMTRKNSYHGKSAGKRENSKNSKRKESSYILGTFQ
jgi:hypothetical protein